MTTLIGLMSLNVSTILPVSQFGYAAAVGSIVALVVGLGITPALLVIWPDCTRPVDADSIRFLRLGRLGRPQQRTAVDGRRAAAGRHRRRHRPVETGYRSHRIPAAQQPGSRPICKDIETQPDGCRFAGSRRRFPRPDLAFLDQLQRVRQISKRKSRPIRRFATRCRWRRSFPTEMPDSPFAAARLLSTAQSQSGQDGLMAKNQQLWRISARIRRDKHRHPVVVMEELQTYARRRACRISPASLRC